MDEGKKGVFTVERRLGGHSNALWRGGERKGVGRLCQDGMK